MIYIIMADGKGVRWNNHNGIPKHLIKFDGITLLQRTTNLLKRFDRDCKVIITTHNSSYETEGATLYAPLHNELEIDRFTTELIDDNICFLYGDTYYSEAAISQIVEREVDDIMFFGTSKSIVSIKIKDGKLFRYHVDRVRDLFLKGEISQCIGWQVYQSVNNLPFGDKTPKENFVVLKDETDDINTPEEYMNIKIAKV